MAHQDSAASPKPDWDLYRALREQWTHEDELVNYRLMWLILSEGLLFTAYGTISVAELHWLIYGFPVVGIATTVLITASISAAFAATEEIARRYEEAGLNALCPLTPGHRFGVRGRWAAKALPLVFGVLWLLALAGTLGS